MTYKPRTPEQVAQIKDEIIDAISDTHWSVANLQKMNPHWPIVSEINKWRRKDPDFNKRYFEARREQTESLVQDSLTVAQEGYTNPMALYSAKFRVDQNSWQAARLMPRKWGDKYKVEVKEDVDDELELVKRIVHEKRKISDID